MRATKGVIELDCFPTPQLARCSTDPAELERVLRFAELQVAAARQVHAALGAEWSALSKSERVRALRVSYGELTQWRYRTALEMPPQIGRGVPTHPDRFRSAIDEHGANYDRLGAIGRLRAHSVWDERKRVYVGGVSTPAYRVMLAYGRAAELRFRREGITSDVLRNAVRLPDGSTVTGSGLVRGATARKVADELVARIARRGGDTRFIETGGDPIYAVTAGDAARAEMFRHAVDLLAGAEPGEVTAWQRARFLLYQAPVMKRGSDAVIRTFLVAVGALLFERPPVLEQDVDLRCLVLEQGAATIMPTDPAGIFRSSN
ncbi:hypothetical protein AB0H71_17570 [Nocardia sp. NPDC050697]|uniref:hypothetical protein n=1 Tax=Nocardia sp. NPDC050697 TaxID=3155158 RepID=UPI0033EDB187